MTDLLVSIDYAYYVSQNCGSDVRVFPSFVMLDEDVPLETISDNPFVLGDGKSRWVTGLTEVTLAIAIETTDVRSGVWYETLGSP